jgi:hypothetical protein
MGGDLKMGGGRQLGGGVRQWVDCCLGGGFRGLRGG